MRLLPFACWLTAGVIAGVYLPGYDLALFLAGVLTGLAVAAIVAGRERGRS